MGEEVRGSGIALGQEADLEDVGVNGSDGGAGGGGGGTQCVQSSAEGEDAMLGKSKGDALGAKCGAESGEVLRGSGNLGGGGEGEEASGGVEEGCVAGSVGWKAVQSLGMPVLCVRV